MPSTTLQQPSQSADLKARGAASGHGLAGAARGAGGRAARAAARPRGRILRSVDGEIGEHWARVALCIVFKGVLTTYFFVYESRFYVGSLQIIQGWFR